MKSNVRLFALCISILQSPQIWADLVTPNDRVTSRLVVRADSNTGSAIRGYLYPGDTTEQIGAAKVIDVRDAVVDDKTFFKTVSDRLPIVARFNTSGPDDD